MARKFYDLVARGPEYIDRDGNKKHENDQCGVLAVEDDGRMWITLKYLGQRVRIAVFEQKDRSGSRGPGGGDGGSSSNRGSAASARSSGGSEMNDDIHF